VADYFRDRDMKYGMTELKIPAFGKPQTNTTAPTPSPTSFGKLVQALHIVPGQSQMLQVTSRQESSQMWLGSRKPQGDNDIVPPMSAKVPDSSQIGIAKLDQPISFYLCI